ncbi:Rad2 nuclease [Perkinsus olseni]|uniref:Multifunctional fusion protein n=1 Tax=Perkinsus olseni TaxID=32597 RepID=A0A7J6PBN9_PEROL|nr:Rad2 nuclease [Perkinsus olseni]
MKEPLFRLLPLLLLTALLCPVTQGKGFFPPENGKVIEIDGDLLGNLTARGESDDTRIVLFYASWCGHCANFASEYEMVAEVFSSVPSLSLFAIDCNKYREACRSAGVDRYPTLVGYRKGEKTGENWDRQIRAANYVNEQLPVELQLSDVPTIEHLRGPSMKMKGSEGIEGSDTASDRVYDGVLAFANLMATAVFPAGVDSLEGSRLDTLKLVYGTCTRSTREQWLDLLAEKPFLGGEITLATALSPDDHWALCGQLSCGLWQFLHHLTLGVDRPYNGQQESDLLVDHTGLAAMSGIRTILSQYFACEECTRHFIEDYDKCLYGRCVGGDAPSREETVMWLWRFHNAVNSRVFASQRPGENSRATEWPSASQCSACVSTATGEYSEKVVYHWIVQTYLGDMLKDETLYTVPSPLRSIMLLLLSLIGIGGLVLYQLHQKQMTYNDRLGWRLCMGVKNLLQYLKGCTATKQNISDFKGKRVGIDAMCWMHRGAIACCFELVSGRESDKFLTFFLRMIALLQGYDVTPVVVFDGCRMPGKAEEEIKRGESRATAAESAKAMIDAAGITQATQMTGEVRTKCMQAIRITNKMIRKVMCALQALGVEFIVAAYEADAQLGYMYSAGLVDAVISEDSDVLAYGCKMMIAKLDQAGDCQVVDLSWALEGGSSRSKETPQRTGESTASKELRAKYGADLANLRDWTKEMFIDACVLAGCDYSHACNLKGMGIKTAMKLVNKYKDWQRTLRALKIEDKFRKQLAYENPLLADSGSLQVSGASITDVVGGLVSADVMNAKICARTGQPIDLSAATEESASSASKIAEVHSKRVAFNKMEFAALTRFQQEYEQLRQRREEQRKLEKQTLAGAEKAREKKGEALHGRDNQFLAGLTRALGEPLGRGSEGKAVRMGLEEIPPSTSQSSRATAETTVEDEFESEMLGGLSGISPAEPDQLDAEEEEFDMADLLNELTANDASVTRVEESVSSRPSTSHRKAPTRRKISANPFAAARQESTTTSLDDGKCLPSLPKPGAARRSTEVPVVKRNREALEEESSAKKPRASFAVFDRATWRKQAAKGPTQVELITTLHTKLPPPSAMRRAS